MKALKVASVKKRNWKILEMGIVAGREASACVASSLYVG